MITNTFNNSVHATVTDAETFTGSTADIRFAACCTIKGNVTDNNIFVRIKACIAVRIDNQLAAGKSLAYMVVGIALQLQRNALRQKGAKALAGTALEVQVDSVGRQSLGTVAAGNFTAQNRADNAVRILNRQRNRNRLFSFQITAADIQQFTHIKRFFQLVVLLFGTNLAGTRLNLRLVQQRRQIQILILPVALLCRLGQQYLGTADHLVDSAEAEHRHIFTNFLRNEVHEVDNIFRLAVEILAQLRILCCHTHRAGIKITYTHHNAADSYQRCCCKAEFLRTQQSGDNNIASCHQLTVCFQCYTVTQIIQQQRLMRFHKSQLPRQSGMVDGSTRRSTGTAVITADKHNIGTGLNYAGSNRTYANLAYQLDADAGTRISILQVMNKLGQIFNRINIMMRRR